MIIKCPRCFKIISTTAQKIDAAGSPICSCGQDLSQFDGQPKTIGERISRRVRVGFKNGMMGGFLGALFSILFIGRIARVVAQNWGTTAGWLVFAAAPLLGFLLAAILGDRFLEQVDDLV